MNNVKKLEVINGFVNRELIVDLRGYKIHYGTELALLVDVLKGEVYALPIHYTSLRQFISGVFEDSSDELTARLNQLYEAVAMLQKGGYEMYVNGPWCRELSDPKGYGKKIEAETNKWIADAIKYSYDKVNKTNEKKHEEQAEAMVIAEKLMSEI